MISRMTSASGNRIWALGGLGAGSILVDESMIRGRGRTSQLSGYDLHVASGGYAAISDSRVWAVMDVYRVQTSITVKVVTCTPSLRWTTTLGIHIPLRRLDFHAPKSSTSVIALVHDTTTLRHDKAGLSLYRGR